MNKNFMNLNDASKQDLEEILDLADFYKKNRYDNSPYLGGQSLGLIFLKSSTRTRVSFEVGIQELGGKALYLDKTSLQFGRGESYTDTAKVLSCYLNGIIIRGHKHNDIVSFAEQCTIPVINALTDTFHPCQLLADLQLIRSYKADLSQVKIAFLGDCASNMANSWVLASNIFDFWLNLAGPRKYWIKEKVIFETANPKITYYDDAKKAVQDVDFIYTDVWVSMGLEQEKEQREKDFFPFQVNKDLLKFAQKDIKIMHCLPAYRGLEISAEVIEDKNSIILEQAENRLHSQKALMTKFFKYYH